LWGTSTKPIDRSNIVVISANLELDISTSLQSRLFNSVDFGAESQISKLFQKVGFQTIVNAPARQWRNAGHELAVPAAWRYLPLSVAPSPASERPAAAPFIVAPLIRQSARRPAEASQSLKLRVFLLLAEKGDLRIVQPP
jgi:hypothetical protein